MPTLQDLQKAVDMLYDDACKFGQMSREAKIDNKQIDVGDIDFLITSVEKVTSLANTITYDKAQFVRENLNKLTTIQEHIASCYNNFLCAYYTEALKKKSSRIYNAMNGALQFTLHKERFQYKVTKTFTDFVKGITYFASEFQPLRDPVYHRNASCGSRGLKTETQFLRTLFGPDQKLYVRRCFIERQIYDHIWKLFYGFQDLGHSVEMRKVSNFYDEYFPTVDLKVKISMLPNTTLHISVELTTKNGKFIETELYVRKLNQNQEYLPDVECVKTNSSGEEFRKTQTFDAPADWVQTK